MEGDGGMDNATSRGIEATKIDYKINMEKEKPKS